MGRPRGKASRESHRSLDPREGKRDTAATAREECARACPTLEEDCLPGETPDVPLDACQHWRGILSLKVETVQGKQVSLEWTETSGGLWEWWHDPGVPLAFPVESASS